MLIFLATLTISHPALAFDFDELEGFTLVKVTRVDGDFEGCDYDKVIKLINGWKLQCNSYRYHYAYGPEVAVFTKDIGSGYMVKMAIDDDVYDMSPILKR